MPVPGFKSQFSYNQNGARTEVKNAVGTSLENSVIYTVDKLSRTLTQNDPDHGTYTYNYDALGQVTEDVSPKLNQTSDSITYQYDLLGRMTSSTEPEGTTTWTYDNTTGGNLGIGQLHSESQTGYTRTYSYASTDYGRLTSVSITIGSDTYTSTQTYNANGQGDTFTYPASYSYPTGLQVQNTYNALGYLERVQNPNTSEVYYQYLDSDAAGRMTQQWSGDGGTLNQTYQAHSSRITSQQTTIGVTDIQEFTYAWDSVGNMSSRSDLINSLTETFTYDNQDRLIQAKVGTATPIDYGYNVIGNITSKSDTGNYSYTLVQDHAVSNITQGATSNDYSYDGNGNLSNGDDVPTITWSSYNKPTQLQKNSITYDFSYGPDRLRYKKVHTTTTSTQTTHYVGNSFEQTQEGTDITYRHVIRAGKQVIAILTDDNGGNTDLKYLHRDHLGSVTVLTDDAGTIIERLNYGPWGQRRDATDWETLVSSATDHRGYTGHEHLDDIGIIHMNGRVYSPKSGRMLSPDPITQSPENGENYNRYSYVMNNPLNQTDPSGYMGCDLNGCSGGGWGGFFPRSPRPAPTPGWSAASFYRNSLLLPLIYDAYCRGGSMCTVTYENRIGRRYSKRTYILSPGVVQFYRDIANGPLKNIYPSIKVNIPNGKPTKVVTNAPKDNNSGGWKRAGEVIGVGSTGTFRLGHKVKIEGADDRASIHFNNIVYELTYTEIGADGKPLPGVYPIFKGVLSSGMSNTLSTDRIIELAGPPGTKFDWTLSIITSPKSCDNCGSPMINIYDWEEE